MLERRTVRAIVGCLLLLLAANPPAYVQMQEPQPKENKENEKEKHPEARRTSATLTVEVKASETYEIVPGAAVAVKSIETGIKYDRTLNTNQQGIIRFSEVPQGKIRIQVVARGYETFGSDYTLDANLKTIPIQLTKRR
jgi:hypothetical protein